MSNHTPGPWKIKSAKTLEGDEFLYIINKGDDVCKTMWDVPMATQIANANLIHAAPDMLEALKMAVGYIEAMQQLYPESEKIAADVKAGHAAIAKAEGE